MSSQKPGKTKQKSLLSWVKPQDTMARVEDENVEESYAVFGNQITSVCDQKYSRSTNNETSNCMLLLIKESLKSRG